MNSNILELLKSGRHEHLSIIKINKPFIIPESLRTDYNYIFILPSPPRHHTNTPTQTN